ncbi:tRNA preQ1(34) S-adenosylmethionine ribosyltransferase-isomerase QueA [Myxococcota bacterium]|nr:tRNA preQ1(34) S-adenosylmethionine ribosyltransferase-isomerase QueA [Myxococcota bacterium]
MLVAEFDFELPEESIARFPAPERDGSRLMVLRRDGSGVEHRRFFELPELLSPDDLVVYNDTKVLPARLFAKKRATGGKVEILLVEPVSEGAFTWRVMVASSKGVRAGAELVLERAPDVVVTVVRDEGEGFVVLDLHRPAEDLAHAFGELPLPPYLGRAAEASDRDRYQTMFARSDAEGSVAAPTAGLHFTPRVIDALAARGIQRAPITLHVGPGTFLPMRVDVVEEHKMHAERFEVPASTMRAIEETRARGGRVLGVGTTVTRVLETLAARPGQLRGSTDLFITPGHTFRGIDVMLTNFHLPKSTLVMLVSALAGRERVLAAYREAVASGYRFFSYGDAMLIL